MQDKSLIIEEIKKLRRELTHHAKLYYVYDAPEISDYDYDMMFDRLKRLEAAGYSVCALELIDPEETPKNIMLRALRRKNFDSTSPEARRLQEEYLAAKAFLVGDQKVSF